MISAVSGVCYSNSTVQTKNNNGLNLNLANGTDNRLRSDVFQKEDNKNNVSPSFGLGERFYKWLAYLVKNGSCSYSEAHKSAIRNEQHYEAEVESGKKAMSEFIDSVTSGKKELSMDTYEQEWVL